MSFKVHRLDVKKGDIQFRLEQFLNNLKGKVVSVFPNVKPTFLMMGGTAKVDYVLIVERI